MSRYVCLLCTMTLYRPIPRGTKLDVCHRCWTYGAEVAMKKHIRLCKKGCQAQRNSLVFNCDKGVKLSEAFFDSIRDR